MFKNIEHLSRKILCGLLFLSVSLALPVFAADINPFDGNPVAEIARERSAAVVNIDTETMVKQSLSPFGKDPFFRQFFGEEFERFSRVVPMRGKGSGFIVSEDGYVLTNNHVVDGADKINVSLSDGRTLEGKVVGKDPTFDIAVVKIEADEDLPVLEMGNSKDTEVGQWVVAIGNPFGLEHTVTVGVISAKNRSVHAGNVNFDGFLQTDAAINPGNSGGPLLDLEGKVIGINTAIVPYAQGIGFAIPIDMARDVMDDLVKYGKVNRGWLGVYIQRVTPEFAEAYGIEGTEGAVVSDVIPGSPADEAGIRRGDVIMAIDDKEIKTHRDVSTTIRRHMAGDKVEIGIERGGSSRTITVILGEIPGQEMERPDGQEMIQKMGISVSPLDEELKEQYDVPRNEGVVVTRVIPDSPADRLGLRKGDLILEVNGTEITGLSSMKEALSRHSKAVVLLIWRDGRTFFVSIRL